MDSVDVLTAIKIPIITTLGLFTFKVLFAKVRPIFKFRTDLKNLDHSALKLF